MAVRSSLSSPRIEALRQGPAAPVSGQAFSDLVGLIYGAALDRGLWAGVLARLDRLMGGGLSCQIMAHDLLSGLPDMTETLGYDPDFITSYERYYGGRNVWARGFAQAPIGQVQRGSDICSVAELERTEFYADWLRPQEDRIGGGGVVLFRQAERNVVFGGNLRRRDVDGRETAWLELVQRLAPHLCQSFDIARALAVERLGRAVDGLGGGLGGGLGAAAGAALAGPIAVVVDLDRRILWASGGARQALDEGSLIGCDGRGRLRLARRAPAEAVAAALAQLARGEAMPRPLRLAFAPGCDLMLQAAPLTPDLAAEAAFAFAGLPARRCLLLSLSRPTKADPAPALAALGLTRSEAAVALALWQGHKAGEIADLRGVSPHTVRNQIKALMPKLGVSRQAELMRRIERLVAGQG